MGREASRTGPAGRAASRGRTAPTGTIQRSPWGDSSDATQTAGPPRARTAARSRRSRPAAARAPAAPPPTRGNAPRPPGPSPTSRSAEREAPVVVAAHQPVRLERDRQPVGGRPRQARSPPCSSASDAGRLAPSASSTATALSSTPTPLTLGSTRARLASQIVRQSRRAQRMAATANDRSPRRSGTATSSTPRAGEPDLLYIDLHLVHEVTCPQAFDGLRLTGRTVRRPDLTVATEDHNVPTDRHRPADRRPDLAQAGRGAAAQRRRVRHHRLYPMGDPGQGIVHVIGPEQGLTQPGMTIVCGDSHTSTHGAFGALAFGIGTSEVEHVLATQTLPQTRPGVDGGHRRRRPARRRHGQGRHPRHHRPHRHRRRHRPRHRVPRLGHPRRSRWRAA